MRLFAASVAALVTLAACQLEIWCLQRHRVAAEPVELRGQAGVLEVADELFDGGGAHVGVCDVIDAAEGLFGVPGVADPAVGVPGVEQAPQPDASLLGDVLRRGDEQLAGPVEGVVFVAAVSQCLVLDSAPYLVEGSVGQPDDVEGVRDLGGVGYRGVERGPIRAREVQHAPADLLEPPVGAAHQAPCGRFGVSTRDYVQQLAPTDVDDAGGTRPCS
jgi:hypothetical protein